LRGGLSLKRERAAILVWASLSFRGGGGGGLFLSSGGRGGRPKGGGGGTGWSFFVCPGRGSGFGNRIFLPFFPREGGGKDVTPLSPGEGGNLFPWKRVFCCPPSGRGGGGWEIAPFCGGGTPQNRPVFLEWFGRSVGFFFSFFLSFIFLIFNPFFSFYKSNYISPPAAPFSTTSLFFPFSAGPSFFSFSSFFSFVAFFPGYFTF